VQTIDRGCCAGQEQCSNHGASLKGQTEPIRGEHERMGWAEDRARRNVLQSGVIEAGSAAHRSALADQTSRHT
jgi:hypothetical protein